MFVGGLAVFWGTASLAVGIAVAASFAWIVVRFYTAHGGAATARLPERFGDELTLEGGRWRISFRALAGLLVVAVILATGSAYLLMRVAWTDRPVTIFAHRGAAAQAPENTLAAFRLAGSFHTDYVELDVQESSDGVVVVVHDSDLMKVGGSALRIWEGTADQLRAVDIGSYFDPRLGRARPHARRGAGGVQGRIAGGHRAEGLRAQRPP